jgi:hypothetical protein
MKPSAILAALALLVVVTGVSACSKAPVPAAFTRVTSASVASAADLSVPPAPILKITGKVSATNDGDALALDVPSLEKLGLVTYKARDPWLEKDLEFSGILLTDLLSMAGADADATSLHLTALDDYQVDISIADAKRWPLMLATQTSGAPMSVEDKGPTRIVYPADPSIDVLKTKDLWIWQLTTIEVR